MVKTLVFFSLSGSLLAVAQRTISETAAFKEICRRSIYIHPVIKPTVKLQRMKRGDDNEEEEEPTSERRKYL